MRKCLEIFINCAKLIFIFSLRLGIYAAEHTYFMKAAPWSFSFKRVYLELRKVGRICLSSLFSDFLFPTKDKKKKSNRCIFLSSLDLPILVSVVTGALLQPNTASKIGALAAGLAVERSAAPAENGRIIISRVEAFGRRYCLQRSSTEVVKLLLDGFRHSTESAYDSAWVIWMHW
jgi:hypothetical protein